MWSFTPVGLTNGAHTIVASETDAAGNTGTTSLTFTLDTTAPAVTESLASDTGASSSDKITSNATLTGAGDANAVVTFKDGAATLGTATANASGVWSFTPTGLADGAHTIVASETDAAGNTGTASLTFTLDTTAPAVTESLASDTGVSSSDKITSNATLTGSGDANAVVTFKEGATTLGTATANASGVWSFTPVGLTNGAHTIVASETDAAGNTGTASLTFTLDTTAPAVTESLSTDTGVSSSDKITSNATLTGSGDANAVVTFKERRHHARHRDRQCERGMVVHADRPRGRGPHHRGERDRRGRQHHHASLTFTLDTTAPAVTESLANDTGVVERQDHVECHADRHRRCQRGRAFHVTAGHHSAPRPPTPAGIWSFTPIGLTNGAHTIVASETDAAGNAASVARLQCKRPGGNHVGGVRFNTAG